jgi:hypothetical protein
MNAVTTGAVDAQVRELKRLRTESAWWRWGALAVVALFVGGDLYALRNSVTNLTQPGPGQTEYANALQEGIQKDIVPQVQDIAGRTLAEMRPQVMASLQKASQRTPELANASLGQLQTLQQNVASRSEQALDATFTKEFAKREGKIKEMFPDATEQQLQTFTQNMTQMGTARLASANDRLFSRHLSAMNGIVSDMDKIAATEKVTKTGDIPTWEVALTTLDLVRDNLKQVAPQTAVKEAKL